MRNLLDANVVVYTFDKKLNNALKQIDETGSAIVKDA